MNFIILILYIKIIIFYFMLWVFYLHALKCTTWMLGTRGGQIIELYFIKLELQTFFSCNVSVGKYSGATRALNPMKNFSRPQSGISIYPICFCMIMHRFYRMFLLYLPFQIFNCHVSLILLFVSFLPFLSLSLFC